MNPTPDKPAPVRPADAFEQISVAEWVRCTHTHCCDMDEYELDEILAEHDAAQAALVAEPA